MEPADAAGRLPANFKTEASRGGEIFSVAFRAKSHEAFRSIWVIPSRGLTLETMRQHANAKWGK